MAKSPPDPAKHDPGELIEVASELMDADRDKVTNADMQEIAAELGVPPEYIDKAVVEVERRRATKVARMRRGVIVASALALVAATVFVVTRGPHDPHRTPTATGTSTASTSMLRGVVVGIDLFRGVAPANAKQTVEARGGSVRPLEQALSDDVLAGVDVLLLDGSSKSSFATAELDAIERFVRTGHGLVVADLGWWWVNYPKKPLEELPANAVGKRLGFMFTAENIGVPTTIDKGALDGINEIARDAWVPCAVRVDGKAARVLVRDEGLRPMVATMEADRGHIAVFGHMAILEQNPALFAWALRYGAAK